MHALGIMYPQYWLHLDYDASFVKHLEVIKATFCYKKTYMCGWLRKKGL
jgi:hypothetical protein